MTKCLANTPSGARCKREATKGKRLCSSHQRLFDHVYYVQINLKPSQRFPDGRYKQTIIPIPFETEEQASNWLYDNWANIMKPFKVKEGIGNPIARQHNERAISDKRFVSACVQSTRKKWRLGL